MKRLSALMLAILLLMTQSVAVTAEATEADEQKTFDQLVVGNTTKMQGYFFTELWGNSTTDIDVRFLLHGYNLVNWDGNAGMFMFDQNVVSDFDVADDAQGNRSYTLTLHEDLYYSDGSPITAWDYAFSILFQIAPELYGAGGKPVRREHLLGYEEYVNGSVDYLAGVRVPDDQTLVITVRAEYLPFFYELGMLYYNPYPIKAIAPGVVVKDDGNGVYLANEDNSKNEPVFTSELIKSAVLDPATGYMSHPTVVSGPYTLTGWDGNVAEFAINPYYKGDFRGHVPTIPKLVFTLAENETMVEKLMNGEFDLLNKVVKAETIETARAMIEENGTFEQSPYPRVGLSYISFACEKPTVASEAVRQAIAWSMDRDALTADYTGNYGIRVDGYYGLGQWMYGAVNGTLVAPFDPPEDTNDTAAMAEYTEKVAKWEALNLDNLTVYGLDTEKAGELLDGDGWTLNAEGLREKEIDGEKITLDLKMIYPEGNKIAETFEAGLIPNLEKIGIRLTLEAVPMAELLEKYYKKGEREMDMIYLATNFDVVFDPSVNFVVDEDGDLNWSYTNHKDEELYRLAAEMRSTEPGDTMEYMHRWIAFQERFNKSLPMLPLYSNVYFDFYTENLHDYLIGENIAWSTAILEASLYEAMEEEAAEEFVEGA